MLGFSLKPKTGFLRGTLQLVQVQVQCVFCRKAALKEQGSWPEPMLESRNCCEAESLNAWSASWKISQIQVCQPQGLGCLPRKRSQTQAFGRLPCNRSIPFRLCCLLQRTPVQLCTPSRSSAGSTRLVRRLSLQVHPDLLSAPHNPLRTA